LLTGEYLVLDGALALASPTHLGQHLEVKTSSGSSIDWVSEDEKGEQWFKATFSLFDFSCEKSNDEAVAQKLSLIFKKAVQLNPNFLSSWKKYKVKTRLEFDRSWGLGSSSTLLSLIAQWAEVNPFHLLYNTIGGSGYDIACATRDQKLLYRLNDDLIEITEVNFDPTFGSQIFFAYSGEKTNSAEAIEKYKARSKGVRLPLDKITAITESITKSKTLEKFESLIEKHESILSEVLGEKTLKESRFKDYKGCIKSLGAWGGDFFLFTARDLDTAKQYFESKGIHTIFAMHEILV
jgi:mevalonate kinase